MSTTPTPDAIRAARVAAGLTQAKAANLVYAGLRTWNRWESGQQDMPLAEWDLFQLRVMRQAIVPGTGDDK